MVRKPKRKCKYVMPSDMVLAVLKEWTKFECADNIPMDAVDFEGANFGRPRRILNDDEVNRIFQSLRDRGARTVLSRLIVTPRIDEHGNLVSGKYDGEDGHRRHAALLLDKHTHVDVLVVRRRSAPIMRLLQAAINRLNGEPESDEDTLCIAMDMLEAKDLLRDKEAKVKTAKSLCMPVGRIEHRIRLDKARDRARALLPLATYALANDSILARLGSISSDSVFVPAIDAGIPMKAEEVKELAKRIRGAKSGGDTGQRKAITDYVDELEAAKKAAGGEVPTKKLRPDERQAMRGIAALNRLSAALQSFGMRDHRKLRIKKAMREQIQAAVSRLDKQLVCWREEEAEVE